MAERAPREGCRERVLTMLRRGLMFGPAAFLILVGLSVGSKFDRYVLPAFDGFVYDAMADNPRVFTIAPWGYRILAPWIVHVLPVTSSASGYYFLTLACLSGTVLVTGAWLRRIGFGHFAAALAGLAFAFSPPLRQMFEYQVLVDPLALWITVLILYELSAPRVVVLMALFAAGALTKETCLVPALAVPFAFAAAKGWKGGLLASVLAVGPGVGLALLLRATWGEPQPPGDFSIFDLVTHRLSESGRSLAMAALVSGLILPALAGFARESSLLIRAQGVLIWLATILSVVLNPYQFSSTDLPRLSAFAWPALLPLALCGFGFVRKRSLPAANSRSRLATLLSLVCLALCTGLALASDPFLHAPEKALKDPIAYLARNRETLKTARLLDEGETFAFDAQSGRFKGPITERFNLTEGRNHRWFLFDGFGADAAYESGSPEFEKEAALLVPVLDPRDATLSLELDAPSVQVDVLIGGRRVGAVEADRSLQSVSLPTASLLRGSNIVTLRGPAGTRIRLLRLEVRLASAPP